MKKLIPLTVLLLLCVFGAGYIIEVDNVDPIHPPVTYQPPSGSTQLTAIVGDWEGYDNAARTTYDLQCSPNKYAELETDDESQFPDIERKLHGTWEGRGNTYTLKFHDGDYTFTIEENQRTAELKTPSGKKVTMYRDY